MPEADRDDIREIFVKPYRMLDLIREDDCYIATVIHGRRDIAAQIENLEIE